MPRSNVTEVDFCRAYRRAFEEGKTYEHLATALGLSRAAVHTRKSFYVKRGVKFPPLAESKRGRGRIEVSVLNSILAGRKAAL
jgi:hypothetical protein